MRVREIAELLGAPFEGDGEWLIVGAAPLETATNSDLSFATDKVSEAAARSSAGCLIATPGVLSGNARGIIRAPNPRAAFAVALTHLYPADPLVPSIHPTAVVAESAEVDPSAEVGAHVSIGAGSKIGGGTRLGPGCVIGRDVAIGARCLLHANVTVYGGTQIGDRVILHSGSVLGADGFGFVLFEGSYRKFPQVGRVVLEDDVEIGANTCIDRAALGVTFIGQGTKLDNMVHIGHNCRIGRHVVIAAQTGLSGGVVIEDYAVIGGQVGVGDKARIESRAVIGSGSGILTSKIVRAGEPLWGTPARPLRQHLEQLAGLARLPKLREQIADLQRRLKKIEEGTPGEKT